MAKRVKERVEEVCVKAGLEPSLARKVVVRVLRVAAAVAGSGTEAELGRLCAEVERMIAAEEEMKELLGATSRDAIVPALEKVLEKLRVLKTAAGLDSTSSSVEGSHGSPS